MANFDNKLNINNVRQAYTPNLKKDDDIKPPVHKTEDTHEAINDGAQAAESYGRILVKKGKIENPEMTKCVQDAIDFYLKHPEIAEKHINCGDLAYLVNSADGEDYPYEDMCCHCCDEAHCEAERN